MAFNKNNPTPGETTEEIFLDEEEFEALLAQAQPQRQPAPEMATSNIYINTDTFGAEIYDADFVEAAHTSEDVIDDFESMEITFDTNEMDFDPGDVEETVMYEPVAGYDYNEAEFDEEISGDDEDVVNIFKGNFADKLIYLTGALIVLLVIIFGVVFITGKTRKAIVGPDMSEVGLNVSQINMIGEQGLTAVLGKEAIRLTDLYEAVENFDYGEVDDETGLINVSISLSSILKDLKIKFVNKNNKLIANVPFQAEVTDSNGKSTIYTDEDKDGMIHVENLEGGNYSVKMLPIEGFESMYAFSEAKETLNVKSKLEYAKVDVANEIKSESQVDVKKEDTKVQETVVESKLEDTVEYVMSSKVASDESGYAEISKSDITDPIKSYVSNKKTGFMKLDNEGDENPEEPTVTNGVTLSVASELTVTEKDDGSLECGSATATATITGNYTNIEWSVSGYLEVASSGSNTTTVTAQKPSGATGSGVLTVKVTFENGEVAQADQTIAVKYNLVQTDQSYFSIVATIGTLYPGQSFDSLESKGTIVVKDKSGNVLQKGQYSLSYSSSDTSVATVEAGGKINALKAGSTQITMTCTAENMTTVSQTFVVYVAQATSTISLDASKKTIFKGGEKTSLKATVGSSSGASTPELVWSSSDSGVVSVDQSGNLTAVNEGSANITVALKSDNQVSASCEIKVVLHPSLNKVSLLKDNAGNQVYVYDEASKKYVEAKFADYYNGAKLYKASNVEYKYMGWWTLNGNTYYFDKNGKKVTGEQVILGTKYNFSSDGVLLSSNGIFGIDVSKWNGTIDWSSVAKSGVSFAIIRSGFRGSTQGGLIEDAKFYTNIKNATAAGIKVGIYFFTQAINEVEAVEEASMVLGQISGYKVSYPIFLDVESAGAGARAEGLSAAQRTAVIKAFCQTISNSGYTAGVYANKTWFTSKINTSELTSYKIWLAQYNSSVTYNATRYDLWQYSSTGSISGISGNVDFNLSYMGY
ncbi:MAG: Ig-like domain-containing protein [Lachnospiraceae bacterium]|nr:Ig-like domain-containing protein [Lachnospiraceae bacterium]